MNELERIRRVYEKRKIEQRENRYSCFNKANLFIIQQRERALIDVLKRFGFSDLSNKKILDVGCGTGGFLREFIKYGAKPENLFGIDLLEDRIETGRSLNPNIDFRCGDASNLSYETHFFDIVMQFTVFTSILDPRMKRKMASEMLRVLKKNGTVIWYDYHVDNPKNPDVKGVKKKEIFRLFPNCVVRLRSVTLAPPVARSLVSYSAVLCELLGKIPFLCTHYLGMIQKSETGDLSGGSNVRLDGDSPIV
jgi:ubiquinone/menaquinone biosynthesis C-methylase UbiE